MILKTIVLNKIFHKKRLDVFLSLFFSNYSRSFFKKCIKNGYVTINSIICFYPKKKYLFKI